jgi:hypothetical protein
MINMMKTISIAAVIAAAATASFAGAITDPIIEEPVAVITPAGSGIGLPVVIGGVAAAVVVAAVISNDDDTDATTETTD